MSKRERFEGWKKSGSWHRVLDHPYPWIGVQVDALLSAGEILEAVKKGEAVNPGDVARRWAELTAELAVLDDVPALARYGTHRMARHHAQWALDVMGAALELAGEKPKKLEKLHLCDCGWQATSRKALQEHRGGCGKVVLVSEPAPDLVEVIEEEEDEARIEELRALVEECQGEVRRAYDELQAHVEEHGRDAADTPRGRKLRRMVGTAKRRRRQAQKELRRLGG